MDFICYFGKFTLYIRCLYKLYFKRDEYAILLDQVLNYSLCCLSFLLAFSIPAKIRNVIRHQGIIKISIGGKQVALRKYRIRKLLHELASPLLPRPIIIEKSMNNLIILAADHLGGFGKGGQRMQNDRIAGQVAAVHHHQ